MRILITGAAGAVGSCVARGLCARHYIRGFDRFPMPVLHDAILRALALSYTVLPLTPAVWAVLHLH